MARIFKLTYRDADNNFKEETHHTYMDELSDEETFNCLITSFNNRHPATDRLILFCEVKPEIVIKMLTEIVACWDDGFQTLTKDDLEWLKYAITLLEQK